ncbi:PREDICTED: uncharacterized protein LOC109173390 [Ipomoea nil]|uniref:uncharacterized protein LOC109173390 n=1 Tax=Ipomoea nil TaxID=35883 RepID=UPI000900B767|nr:PREDICTED: uncharacterized protein LOC109173390 [Ipomoea nil]
MADPVRNIIIKLGRKVHSPDTALKHIETLLQLARKKKLKLDPLLRDEILVTVMSNYPEFYADWSVDDVTELLVMVAEADEDVSPVSIPEPDDGNRAGAFLPVDPSIPSSVYVLPANVSTLDSVKSPVNVDPPSLPLTDISGEKHEVLHVNVEKTTTSEEPNPLSLVVYDSEKSALPASVSVNLPKEPCTAIDPPTLPTVETGSLPSHKKSGKTGGIPVYAARTMEENLEHARYFAGLPTSSIPQPYRVIHPSNSSSEDDKILAEVYGSQAPSSAAPTVEDTAHTDTTNFKIREIVNVVGSLSANVSNSSHSVTPIPSPTKETRRTKRKNVPTKVVVETSADTADVDQPAKKRKPSESGKPESDPPIQQVFKTLRSSVKPKGSSDVPSASVPAPSFVSSAAQNKWAKMVRRELIVQRTVDSEVGLLKTVTDVCPYSKLLTYEFYCNLSDEIDDLVGPRPMQIFIRGRWYVFGPDMINDYYGLPAVQEEDITDWNLVAKTLTGGQTTSWPTGDKDYLLSSHLTSKYVILHRLALHNWLPSAHFNTVGKLLAGFLFRIGTKMKLDLGKWIYYHILTLTHPREQKVRLPFPNLIFGILTSQGLKPMTSEVISPTLLYTLDKRLLSGDHIKDVVPVTAPTNSELETVNDESLHDKDVKLSEQLKARVAKLETVHGIIAKQLTGSRTELATVLLRMSLTESAAAVDPEKTDSDSPSNV